MWSSCVVCKAHDAHPQAARRRARRRCWWPCKMQERCQLTSDFPHVRAITPRPPSEVPHLGGDVPCGRSGSCSEEAAPTIRKTIYAGRLRSDRDCRDALEFPALTRIPRPPRGCPLTAWGGCAAGGTVRLARGKPGPPHEELRDNPFHRASGGNTRKHCPDTPST